MKSEREFMIEQERYEKGWNTAYDFAWRDGNQIHDWAGPLSLIKLWDQVHRLDKPGWDAQKAISDMIEIKIAACVKYANDNYDKHYPEQ